MWVALSVSECEYTCVEIVCKDKPILCVDSEVFEHQKVSINALNNKYF